MAFVVLYDANVLYPSMLRDLLIRVAQAGLVQAKWTDEILDEVFDNLTANRPDLDPQKLARARDLMNKAVRDSLVTGYEPLIEGLDLPDPGDRHVLAAAIKSRSQVIVTNNLRDFPAAALEPWDLEAKSADDFILDQIDLNREAVLSAVQRIADSRTRPPATFAEVVVMLERDGLVETAAHWNRDGSRRMGERWESRRETNGNPSVAPTSRSATSRGALRLRTCR